MIAMKSLRFASLVVFAAVCALLGTTPAFAQSVITQWKFTATAAAPDNSPAPTTGSGTATVLGMTNSYTYSNGTATATNAGASADVALTNGTAHSTFSEDLWRIRGAPITNGSGPGNTTGTNNALANGWNLSAPQYSQGVEFDLSTAGFANITASFDWYATTQGVRDLQEQYSLDGATWTNLGSPLVATSNDYFGAAASGPTNTISFAAIPGANNDPTFGIRLVSAYDPTYNGTGSPTYTAAALTNGSAVIYNNNSGNWRFGNITFTGTASAVPEPGTAALMMGLSCLGLVYLFRRWRGFRQPGGAVSALLVFATILAAAAPASAQFIQGDLVVSSSNYTLTGQVANLTVGQLLPGGGNATADGTYPNVFNNASPDASFGVTSPISLLQFSLAGVQGPTIPVPTNMLVTSFPSKSEIALNLSPDGHYLTFMGYVAPVGSLDISNSNTPGIIEPGNPVTATPTYRAVAQMDANANLSITTTNAYPGNNGRAAILANGVYYTVGNGGNGNGSPQVTNATGVQIVTPGVNATANTSIPGTNPVGQFNINTVINPATNTTYAADKVAKDNNFRGETIFNNTLYVSKGSGSNGIDTVYQVGNTGTLPNPASAASTPITVLPGFNTVNAKTAVSPTNPASNPFGLYFANSTTLYVGDEGDGVYADLTNNNDPNSGLQKWSLVNGTWHFDYVLQNGLHLGSNYTVSSGNLSYFPTATDGLRNITGEVLGNGTVDLFGITSTVSGSGDQGADPNMLVAIADNLSATTLPGNETFTTVTAASYGQVLRGVSFAPSAVPEPSTYALVLGAAGLMVAWWRRRSLQA